MSEKLTNAELKELAKKVKRNWASDCPTGQLASAVLDLLSQIDRLQKQMDVVAELVYQARMQVEYGHGTTLHHASDLLKEIADFITSDTTEFPTPEEQP